MNIGDASERSGLPAKTIRYYEDIRLLKPARGDNGYRDYSNEDVHRLRFLQRARSLGFSVEECRQLLSLYGDSQRESADVKAIAGAKLVEIDRKIAELTSLWKTLQNLLHACHGDERPDCPILEELSGGEPIQHRDPSGRKARSGAGRRRDYAPSGRQAETHLRRGGDDRIQDWPVPLPDRRAVG